MSDLKVPNYILKEANKWLQKPYDKETQQEIHKLLQSNPKQIIDAFFRNIAFGTGGLRGLMGVGTNRINIYTIQKTTQGLANYILEKKINNPKVFISFDSRVNSKVFAQEAAKVLAGNNINVLITDSLRPTPLVSFGCRHYHCCAAIMITASHNPAEYNGYKVYWSDGGQVVPPHDKEIINHVNQVQDISTVKIAEPTHPLIEFASQKTDNAYLGTINQLQNFPEVNKKNGDKLSIIYSSLHGCGIELIPQALSEWGFTNLSVVLKQANPDGSFPTINTPNPEQSEALELGINQLEKEQKDIFIASDPDADRLGVVALHKNIHYTFTGNQIAAICLYYLCSVKKLSKNHACITTIVTTELLKEIARSFDIQYVEVLTGFKYIGEIITEWESSKDHKFLFGAEESLGYLYGDHARDKDAVVSSCLIAEIALYLKLKDMTLVDYLEEIYAKYGTFQEGQISIQFDPGKEGMEKMSRCMEQLRNNPIKTLLEKKIVEYQDLSHPDNSSKLPFSNVLLYRLDDRSKFIIRPSGTEPKIKIYGLSRFDNKSILGKFLSELKTILISFLDDQK